MDKLKFMIIRFVGIYVITLQ